MKIMNYAMLALFCLLVLMPVGIAEAKMPAGSYLSQPAPDVEALCANLKGDSLVGARFSKHYGMSVEALCEYFRENVTVSRLPKTTVYTVWYVDVRGQRQVKNKQLRAGVRVFVGPNGQPLIETICGNPLTKTLPPVVKVQPVVEKTAPPPPPPPVPEPVVPPPVSEAAVEILPVAFVEPIPVEPVVEVLDFPPMELVNIIAPTLAAVGAVALLGDKSEVIPEPSTLLALGMGGSGLLITGLRRRIRRQHR